MGKRERQIERLKQAPRNFQWSELVSLLEWLGFSKKSGGNGFKFHHSEKDVLILLHPPHPENEVNPVYLRQVTKKLLEAGIIN